MREPWGEGAPWEAWKELNRRALGRTRMGESWEQPIERVLEAVQLEEPNERALWSRVHRSRDKYATVIKSIRYAQENWVSTMLNTNITFILAKNDGNHVAF